MRVIEHGRTSEEPAAAGSRSTDQLLLAAITAFAVAVLIHNGDHVRRSVDAIDLDVFWVGSAAIVLEVVIVVLGTQRHRLAPLAALAGGGSLAVGYAVVHFLPERSWLSDSFTSATDVSPLSWAAATIELVAAVALAAAGLVVMRARGGLVSAARPHPVQRSLRAGVHPVAVTFVVVSAVMVAVSFIDLAT